MVRQRTEEELRDEFVESAEKPRQAPPATGLPIRNAIAGEPAWKTRNRERKDFGTQFRMSESQLKLLQMAKADQEKSIQKILEAIVWPAMEAQYGVTEEDSPS